ncbi:hypothetical protein [Nocardia sp. NBC_00511]|uniref:hypothetical protein n=1 Tax=Nocardia sp. NBC_00511 TaxID=2903591 RepID=UPI0030E2E88A
MTRTSDGGFACDECARDHYETCFNCFRGALSLHDTADLIRVCSDCRQRYHKCGDCSQLIERFRTVCRDCRDRRRDDRVQYCSYTPPPAFHGDGDMYLGLELAVETGPSKLNRCVDLAVEHLGDLGYLRENWSSTDEDYGFQLVTHPMTYSWAIANFPWTVLAELRENGAFIKPDAGIGVRVSRSGFTDPQHFYRWLKFVYRNEFRAAQRARRTCTWTQFDADASEKTDNENHTTSARLTRLLSDPIISYPAHVYEIRIPLSSLHPQQVQTVLAFVAASVDYNSELNTAEMVRRSGRTWAGFLTWVRSHRLYAPLLADIQTLGFTS